MKQPKKAPSDTERVTVTVRLEKALKRRAAVYAAQTDADLQDVVSAALDEYLKKRSA